jgi:hypothetical protein
MPCPRALDRLLTLAFAIASLAAACLAAAGCSPDSSAALYPSADLRPPGLVEAGPAGSRVVLLRFDESVTLVAGSLAVEPDAEVRGHAEGERLVVDFDSDQKPGADYSLVGEVEDGCGNRTRFLVRFTGWNDRAPRLLLSEVQTGKNSSKTKPHRDFVELEVLEDGNVGGEELSWSSSVKSATYRFPGIDARKGDFIVLHLAPEGIPEEKDELGVELSSSGGVDATATGRDLWCAAMALPDENGIISLALRPGGPPVDGLFYADDAKSGALGAGRLAGALSALVLAGIWPLSDSEPAWTDGVPWSGSTARSLCRSGQGNGPSAWYIGASGAQSPGSPNGAAPAAPEATAAMRLDAAKSAATKSAGKALKNGF